MILLPLSETFLSFEPSVAYCVQASLTLSPSPRLFTRCSKTRLPLTTNLILDQPAITLLHQSRSNRFRHLALSSSPLAAVTSPSQHEHRARSYISTRARQRRPQGSAPRKAEWLHLQRQRPPGIKSPRSKPVKYGPALWKRHGELLSYPTSRRPHHLHLHRASTSRIPRPSRLREPTPNRPQM